MEEDVGIVYMNEGFERCQGIYSSALLQYYVIGQEDKEDDAIWEALIEQGGQVVDLCPESLDMYKLKDVSFKSDNI